MKIFLTGATGFLGSALVDRFLLEENDVVCLFREKINSTPVSVKQVFGDLKDLSSLSSSVSCAVSNDIDKSFSMSLECIDVVVHTAARAHVIHDEVLDPLDAYRKVNRDATLRLAKMAAEAGVKRFVFVSSVGVNGNKNTYPFLESDQPNPHDPYSVSKFEAEMGLLALANEMDMEVVIIRPPLVYGPNAPGNFGSLVKWVKKGVPLPLGSVSNQRSFVALENLVDFIELCTDFERSPCAANEVFLISDGDDISTSFLIQKLATAYGAKLRLLPVPVGFMKFVALLLGKSAVADRLFGNLQVDSSKARSLLGWRPVITIEEQLAKMARADDA